MASWSKINPARVKCDANQLLHLVLVDRRRRCAAARRRGEGRILGRQAVGSRRGGGWRSALRSARPGSTAPGRRWRRSRRRSHATHQFQHAGVHIAHVGDGVLRAVLHGDARPAAPAPAAAPPTGASLRRCCISPCNSSRTSRKVPRSMAWISQVGIAVGGNPQKPAPRPAGLQPGQVQRNRVAAAKIVEQPAVDAVAAQILLNDCQVHRFVGSGCCPVRLKCGSVGAIIARPALRV
jgi:hypothetical protein